ncbi:MAG: hypothetical protein ACTSP4_07050 [Candidatus Hodarchaeales archaeon]
MSAGNIKNSREEPPFWKYFKKHGFVAFGDYGEGDLNQYRDYDALFSKLNEIRGINSHRTAKWYLLFKDKASKGDSVIVYHRNTIWGVGIFDDDEYYYQNDQLGLGIEEYTFPHRRKVKWISTEPVVNEDFSILKYPQQAFFKLNQEQERVIRRIIQL